MKRVSVFAMILLLGIVQESFTASAALAAETEAKIISVVVGQDAAAVEREEILRRSLFNAVGKSDMSEVKRLLALGAPIDGRDRYGWTALMCAAQGPELVGSSKIDIVKMLIDARADINSRANCGSTALMKACFDSEQDKVKVLLAAGVDINTQNIFEDSALMAASLYAGNTKTSGFEREYQAHLAQIRKLIFAGADVALVQERKTALDVAREKGFEKELLQMMEDKVVYESRCAEVFSLLTEYALLPIVLVDLIKEYEIEQEYAFLLERARNMQKRVGKKRKNMD